jgi:O-antigen/teichoic acid export membrane protein
MELFYGNKYSDHRLAISLLAANLLVSAVAFTYSRALFAMERADVDFKVNIVTLIVLTVLGLWLVKNHGIEGAAIGALTANAGACAVRHFSFVFLIRTSTKSV